MAGYMFDWTHGLDGAEDAYHVRRVVFVDEQGFVDDIDADDARSWHLTVRQDGEPVAAARLLPEGDTSLHAGRICVLQSHRGAGLGRRVMEAVAEQARALGARRIMLGAQEYAAPFYEKCGYRSCGPVFFEQGAPHVPMKKSL